MSYNIAVANFILPNDFDKACEIVNPLTDEDVEIGDINEAYLNFYNQLIKTYPCLCSVADEEVDNSIWSDGPLINNFTVKTPVIGFVYSKVDEALPIVIDLALKHGLSVLDWQAEKAYYPIISNQN